MFGRLGLVWRRKALDAPVFEVVEQAGHYRILELDLEGRRKPVKNLTRGGKSGRSVQDVDIYKKVKEFFGLPKAGQDKIQVTVTNALGG